MYCHQYDPRSFFDGAGTWLAVHDDVVTARLNVEALVFGATGAGWRGEDGRAFQRRMDAYLSDLRGIEIRAVVTAITLYVAGAVLAALLLFQFLVAVAMTAVAAWVLVAAVTPLSLASARLVALQCLIKLFEGFRAVERLVDTVMHGCAAVLGAAVVVDVGVEAAHGDTSGLRDLAAGTFAQGPLFIWGTANRVERDLTAHGVDGVHPRSGKPLPPGLPQLAGAKAVNDIVSGSQTVTGRYVPEQAGDGSYTFPWE
ncbi:hypothetical protein [Nonomuraea jiangxiensis]|uniref:Uncharacterized protein n=1 Tax=Nonomuraea jiangxiensis TaxID=633440 RepID=A0A1G8EKP2_9ACTN|nr:hypothetical protein [Nonomuraea jiangxiensis]SDH70436.1 hypothetical protein SAMN05421869_10320 [Nonomuraea jiangxiensis]